MAAHMRAPKQWSLTKQETITSFEAWRQNLQYTLSLDQNFAPFLVDGFTWLKKSPGAPLRGLTDDGEPIPEAQRRTAAQKITQLELMLGQIANFCPVISRNTIVKNSVSVSSIWQSIRLHYGFQSTIAHFIDFNSIKLEPGERPEDLYQRLQSFIEDNLLRSDGSIRHYGEIPNKLVMKCHFYALDLPKAIERTYNSCHTCLSLQKFPDSLVKQASEDPPETIGLSFAADILKRERQLILVMRETVTSYTTACIVHDEKQTTLKEALACLATELHPLDGPPAVIRVDPAPGFMALRNDETLKSLRLWLEIGRVKNPNKNPVAEKAILELEEELLKQDSTGGPVSQLNLAIAIARLNSRIRYSGLSAREFWTQRSQFTHEQMPISDRENLIRQHTLRAQNHPSSEKSKHKSKKSATSYNIDVGDLVYLYSDKDKSRARSRYLVVSIDGEWCFIKKFSGNQLRSSSYKVKREECYLVSK